jgi:DNA mismatch endonuclease (patch repair protein)
MSEKLSPEQRSALMSRIRGKDTLPERLLCAELDRLGADYVRNDRSLPGTPDVALYGLHVAVFVHGCFWHGCPEHYCEPRTRTAFWRQKLMRTKRRDKLAIERLRMCGWKVAVLWEHEVRDNPAGAARRVLRQA